jgi:hypothetical protein
MLSDAARRLHEELKKIPGGKLCVVCAGALLATDRDGILKTMRELVTTGDIIHGQFRCSACHCVELFAFLRPFGSRYGA